MVKKLFLLPVLICILTTIRSQSRAFDAGLVAGLNFAELEGDGIMDYFGPNAGLLGRARLSKHFELGVEILYSQNGEYMYCLSFIRRFVLVRFGYIIRHLGVNLKATLPVRRERLDWTLASRLVYTLG